MEKTSGTLKLWKLILEAVVKNLCTGYLTGTLCRLLMWPWRSGLEPSTSFSIRFQNSSFDRDDHVRFFFMAHLIFISNSAHDSYSCIGTSGKKLPKPSWGGCGKKPLHRVFDRNPMSTPHVKGSIYTPTPVELKQQFVKFYVKWCMPILYEHNIKRFLFVNTYFLKATSNKPNNFEIIFKLLWILYASFY